ncbi:MAG: TonB-dependent receptor domain-containing protein [Bryobacteraceae bacterium]
MGNVAVPQSILSQQGQFTQKNNPLVAFGRLDYQLSQNNSVNLQYTYAAQNGLNFGGVSGITTAAVTNNTILDRASQGVKAGLTTVFTPALLNEVRGQWAYDNRTQTPNSPLPQIAINDFGTLGGNANGSYIYEATRYEILDNLSWTRGIHSFRFGVDSNFNPQRQSRETNPGGLYTFNTFADYLALKVARYQQALPANGTQGLYKGTQQDHGIYTMDTIKLRPDLTITAGLRWDGQIEPQPDHPNPKYPITSRIPNDLKMWQPRLGIAYDVAGQGKTVVRLSAGLYDARTPAYLIQRAFTDNGIDVLVLDTNTDPSILKLLTPPNGLTSIPSGVKTPINAVYAMDANYKNPRSFQGAATLEQQIDPSTKLTIGYTRNSTWGLQRRYDRNLFPPTILPNGLPVYPTFDSKGNLVQASGFNATTGQPIFTDSTVAVIKPAVARPDPTIGQFNVNESSAHSSYNGLSINVTRRFSRRLQVLLNYTYSFTHDDDSNERDFNRQQALDTYNLKLDAAYSRTDIRHNGNVSGIYDLPWGFTLSTIVFAHTGLPYRAVTGFDTQNDGNTVNDVPIYNGRIVRRFTFRQPGFFDWDMRLLKTFNLGERMRLSFSIEGFNLTRAGNKGFGSSAESTYGVQLPNGSINPIAGLPFTSNTAGVPSAIPGTDRFGGARQGQLGARFVF